MKKNLALLIFILININAVAQSKIDVLHYRFEITLNDESDTIHGKATIRFLFNELTTGKAVHTVPFQLKNQVGTQKGMKVTEVHTLSGTRLTFKEWRNTVNIECPPGLAAGDTFSVVINYKGIPADGLIISNNKFGKRTFFSDNWPNRAHNWLPCKDEPGDKAAVDFIITAPNHYQVISNGIQVEETNLPGNKKLTHYKEEIPLPTKIMVIGVAEFAVNQVGLVNDCIPVSSWVFPENKTEGFEDYAVAKEILEYYTRYIGPYAYKKLANVQSKTIFGGMENASAIFYFENSVNGKKNQEALIAHEIVHQWFGNMATEKTFAHFWLSEGFATYLTHMYLESKYGTDSLAKRMAKDRLEIIDFVKNNPRPVVDSTSDYMSLLNENSYQKGSWFLHMLRNETGDSLFHKLVRTYFERYSGKNADTRDFQRIAEELAGKDLNTFFNQWLYRPENPSLAITWRYDASKKEVSVHLKQLQKSLFDLNLDFGLVTSSGPEIRYTKRIHEREHHFNFSMPEKPVTLAVDLLTRVLIEFTIREKQ